MNISEETLLAYVDDELDAAARAEVDAALQVDPALAGRVAQQRSLRRRLRAAYDPVLAEPLPERLVAAVQPAESAKPARVVDLATARRSRAASTAPAAWRSPWQWGAMAACLAAGVFAGHSGWLGLPGDDIASRGGQLVAGGELARALSTQLAARPPADASVRIGVSFRSRDGAYCRSFAVHGTAGGLACRRSDKWELRVLAQDRSPVSTGPLRMAASPLVLRAIDEEIEGDALDAQAERAAMARGWRP